MLDNKGPRRKKTYVCSKNANIEMDKYIYIYREKCAVKRVFREMYLYVTMQVFVDTTASVGTLFAFY